MSKKLRNVAIIAHVDHGKTSLVDAMLKQTQTFASHQKELQQTTILDSNELERERGVTILAKNTAVIWNDYKINILDTPGHADFSGEVERVLGMADGCILLVDAAEGVLSQTKFVLRLALGLNLKLIVVINKVDRKDQRALAVEQEVADLVLDLATDESQLEYPVLFARGLEGIAGSKVTELPDHSLKIDDSSDLSPLFESITNHTPAPKGDMTAPLQVQVNSLDWDDYKGKISIGKVSAGTINRGQKVCLVTPDGKQSFHTIEHLFTHLGLSRQEADKATAGEIIAFTGVAKPAIGDTITDTEHPVALPALSISEPTVKMKLSVNTSPFVGKEAKFSTSRQLRDRLTKELETNVGLRLQEETGEGLTITGRGELHISILIETMRREGYEFSLSRPEVVIKQIDGKSMEPWEQVVIEIPEIYTGTITGSMAKRQGVLQDTQKISNTIRFTYDIATSNLMGYRNELLTSTSGEGVISGAFLEYRPLGTLTPWHRGGAIIAHEAGTVTAYSVDKAQQRSKLMVNPGEEIYKGQVVGINNRSEDMKMNLAKGKKLTNMRAASADATIVITPAWKPSLEEFLNIIADDEILEVTPKSLRLRKKKLN